MIPYILAAVGGYLIGDSLKAKLFAGGGMIDEARQVATEDIDNWSDDEVAEYLGIQEDEVNYVYREDAIQKRTDYYLEIWKDEKYAKGEYKMASGGMMANGVITKNVDKINIFRINIWSESITSDDFILVTDLTRKEVSKVIKTIEKQKSSAYWSGMKIIVGKSKKDYILRLKETYPDNLIISKEPVELNFYL